MQTEHYSASNAQRLPLYSVRAVRVFSVLFSAVAGGVLTAQNLKDVGQPAAARTALWGSIGYTAAVLVLAFLLPASSGGAGIGFVVGYAGALGLEAYFKKYVENREEFPAKRIGKPLLICLLVFVPLVALVIYGMAHAAA